MSLPLGQQEIKKLKLFVDFVLKNPTILNLPKLFFMKNLVEKFGGIVPAGEFKMPTKTKLSFVEATATVKTEPKFPESAAEDEEYEMSEESEMEFDMEATFDESKYDVATNAVYLQETAPLTQRAERQKNVKRLSTAFKNVESCYAKRKTQLAAEPEDPFKSVDCDEVNESSLATDDENASICNVPSSDDDIDSSTEQKPVMRTRACVKNSGKEHKYVGLYGKKRSRKPKPVNCAASCKRKCAEKIDEEMREQLCAHFWALDFVERKNYLIGTVETNQVVRISKYRKTNTMRPFSVCYYLTAEELRIRVCHKFFLATFAISDHMIKDAINHKDNAGNYGGLDRRGGHKTKICRTPKKEEAPQNSEPKVLITENSDSKKDATYVVSIDPNLLEQTVAPKLQSMPAKSRSKPNSTKGQSHKDKLHVPAANACETNCRTKCLSHFSEEQRQQICNTFWSMDYKRRKDFVLGRVQMREVTTMLTPDYRKTMRTRKYQNHYFLNGAHGENLRVCKKFFTTTLCISRHFIENAQQFADKQTGSFMGEDMRGKNTKPANKIPDEMLQEVRHHIESYPTWMPHKNYKTRFLHSSLNISQMWREYSEPRKLEQHKFVSVGVFSKIFHKEYRLAFLKPTSKHAHKVSPQMEVPAQRKKCSKTAAPAKAANVNKNISEFTGDERGGFWLQPENVDYAMPMPCTAIQPNVQTTTIASNVSSQPSELMYLPVQNVETTQTIIPLTQNHTHHPTHIENVLQGFHIL